VKSGMLILVVGPSGAGKDSLLRAAMAHFAGDARFSFPRRVVTRQAQAETEDHDSLSTDEFEIEKQHGAFALHWQAHGLSYGVPASILDVLAAGRNVVANVSRSIIPDAMARFEKLAMVEVTAPPEVLLERLQARGRVADGDLAKRVERAATPFPAQIKHMTIRNAGTLHEAEQAFIAALNNFAQFKGF
jgi:ribose 1,5-bisphosphokinase